MSLNSINLEIFFFLLLINLTAIFKNNKIFYFALKRMEILLINHSKLTQKRYSLGNAKYNNSDHKRRKVSTLNKNIKCIQMERDDEGGWKSYFLLPFCDKFLILFSPDTTTMETKSQFI